MRRQLFFFLITVTLIFPLLGSSGVLRLASWNIRSFSSGSRDDEELKLICDVLKGFDLIGIVELRNEEAIRRAERTLELMGRDYDHLISPPVGRKVKERYAFLFDRERIRAIDEGKLFPDPEDEFIREPFYATFRAGRFDFTLILIHVIWGESVWQRRAEVRKLDDVFTEIEEMDPLEQDVILMGDFNLEPDDEGFEELRSIPTMICLFKPPLKSHVRDTSLYDNIWFQERFLSEYAGRCGIYRFDEEMFGNDDDLASLAVSDHRPVWAEFLTERDDDGIGGYLRPWGLWTTLWGWLKIRER